VSSLHPARRLWLALEPIHCIAYFHPGPTDALKALGLKGFWMSYFAGRFAPLGAVGAGPVTALAYGFAPSMVQRALPDAWSLATPEQVVSARIGAAAAALATVPGVADAAALDELVELAESAAAACSFDGRALAAGWGDVARPTDALGRLWLAATVLREHRGDGHVNAAVGLGLSGLEATATLVATGALPRAVIAPNRGWTDADWDHAHERLRLRGLLDDRGGLTPAGASLRAELEAVTDRLATAPADVLGPDLLARLVALSTPLSRALVDAGLVPMPNPIGVPRS